jgi:hypothetical protein
MGWDFGCQTLEQALAEIRSMGPGFRVVKEAFIPTRDGGGTWFAVVSGPFDFPGLDECIAVTMIEKSSDPRMGYGYKCMDETMGPYVSGCPAEIIRAAKPLPAGLPDYAYAWRGKQRA